MRTTTTAANRGSVTTNTLYYIVKINIIAFLIDAAIFGAVLVMIGGF